MDTLTLRELVHVPGPFASVYLPSAASWRVLRLQLAGQHVDERTLGTIDKAVGGRDRLLARALVMAGGMVLVDEQPSWSPPGPVARVSDLPYLLPFIGRLMARDRERELVPAGVAAEPAEAGRSAYDQFVFEVSRPGGLAVDGLDLCTRSLRERNVDALVIQADRLTDQLVWLGGHQWDLVSTDDSLRGTGVPIIRERADEALPMAALAAGADVIVTSDPLPLADGVGVLLRHP
jgi:hypothetical protein